MVQRQNGFPNALEFEMVQLSTAGSSVDGTEHCGDSVSVDGGKCNPLRVPQKLLHMLCPQYCVQQLAQAVPNEFGRYSPVV